MSGTFNNRVISESQLQSTAVSNQLFMISYLTGVIQGNKTRPPIKSADERRT